MATSRSKLSANSVEREQNPIPFTPALYLLSGREKSVAGPLTSEEAISIGAALIELLPKQDEATDSLWSQAGRIDAMRSKDR